MAYKGIRKRAWSDDDIALLQRVYPYVEAKHLTALFRRTEHCIWRKASKLGIEKSEEFMSELASRRQALATVTRNKNRIERMICAS